MAEIAICGQRYPLCLTVAVLDDLEVRGLRLKDIDSLYTMAEGEDYQDVIEKALWLLEALMRRGAEHEALEGGSPVYPVPEPEELRCVMTPGQVLHEAVPAIIEAIGEGLARKIETARDTKKDGAGRPSP